MDTVGFHTDQTNRIILDQAFAKLKIINKKSKFTLMGQLSTEQLIGCLEEVFTGTFKDKTLELSFQEEISVRLSYQIKSGVISCLLEIPNSFGYAIEENMIKNDTFTFRTECLLAKLKQTEQKLIYPFVTTLTYLSEDILVKIGGVPQKIRSNKEGRVTFDYQSQTLDFSLAVPPLPPNLSVPPPQVLSPRVPQPTGNTVRRDLFASGRLPLRSASNNNQTSSSEASRDEANIAGICQNLQHLQSQYGNQRGHQMQVPSLFRRETRGGKTRGTGARHRTTNRETKKSNDYESINSDANDGKSKPSPKTSTPRPEIQQTEWYPVLENAQALPQSDPNFLPQQMVRAFFSSLCEERKKREEHLNLDEVTRIAHRVGLFQLPDDSSLRESEIRNILSPLRNNETTETEDEITFKEKDNQEY